MGQQLPQRHFILSVSQDRNIPPLLIMALLETRYKLGDPVPRAMLELRKDFHKLLVVVQIPKGHLILGNAALEDHECQKRHSEFSSRGKPVRVLRRHGHTVGLGGGGERGEPCSAVDEDLIAIKNGPLCAGCKTARDSGVEEGFKDLLLRGVGHVWVGK